ncbi:MAG: hypothetical protein K8I60_13725 [Anaerolineae bacterium]|nr:hypothetical protein [Anaerolineae bacterium]
MQEKLFRKAALENISSPEELDQLMQITNPRGWLALVALLLLLGITTVIGIFAIIPVQVDGVYCVLAKDPQAALQAVVFVSTDEQQQLTVGNPVQIVPFNVSRTSGRFIYGTVLSIAPRPAYAEEMDSVIHSADLVNNILNDGSVVEVRVTLTPNAEGTGFQWSGEPPSHVEILSGIPCQASITVDEQPPINLILRTLG